MKNAVEKKQKEFIKNKLPIQAIALFWGQNCIGFAYWLSMMFLLFLLSWFIVESQIDFVAIMAIFRPWLVLILIALIGIVMLFKKLAITEYNNCFYQIKKDNFYYEKGIFGRKQVTVPYHKIQNIDIYRTLIDRIFNAYTLKIYTAGSSAPHQAQVVLAGLNKEVSSNLKKEIIKRVKETAFSEIEQEEIREQDGFLEKQKLQNPKAQLIFIFRYMLWGIVGLPIYAYATHIKYQLEMQEFYRELNQNLEQPINLRNLAQRDQFPEAEGLTPLIIIMLLVVVISFAMAKLYYKTYRYALSSNYFYQKSGVIRKSEIIIEYSQIQNVDIRQTFFSRKLGLYALIIKTGGGLASVSGLEKKEVDLLYDELIKKTKKTE